MKSKYIKKSHKDILYSIKKKKKNKKNLKK